MVLAGTALGLAACQTTQTTPELIAVAQPSAAPVATETRYGESLRCMDEVLSRLQIHRKKDLFALRPTLAVAQFDDHTGVVNVGIRQMLVGAVASMTRQSQAVGYKFNVSARDTAYVITGGITQADKGISRDQAGIGGQDKGGSASGGLAADRGADVIAVDINVFETRSRELRQDVSTREQVSVQNHGGAATAAGTAGSAALTGTGNFTRAESTALAVRSIVELAAIEAIGKLMTVPYWHCLEMPTAQPEHRQQLREEFRQLAPQEQRARLVSLLQEVGYSDAAGWSEREMEANLADLRGRHGLGSPDKTRADIYVLLHTLGYVRSLGLDVAQMLKTYLAGPTFQLMLAIHRAEQAGNKVAAKQSVPPAKTVRDARPELTFNEIREVQNALIDLGYPNLRADGVVDAATKDAVRQFQADTTQAPTGLLDYALLVDLRRRTGRADPALQAAPQLLNSGASRTKVRFD